MIINDNSLKKSTKYLVLANFPKAARTKGFRPARGSIIGFGLANALGG